MSHREKTLGRPKTCWRDYLFFQAWEQFGSPRWSWRVFCLGQVWGMSGFFVPDCYLCNAETSNRKIEWLFHWEETRGRPRTYWRGRIPSLVSEHLGIPQEELRIVVRERDVEFPFSGPVIISKIWPQIIRRKWKKSWKPSKINKIICHWTTVVALGFTTSTMQPWFISSSFTTIYTLKHGTKPPQVGYVVKNHTRNENPFN